MNNQEPIYDILYIGRKLQQKIDDFSLYEIQFFAYFSCLLSLYDGNAVNKWSYTFIKSDFGSPYSLDIQKAIPVLIGNSFINTTSTTEGYFRITKEGLSFLAFLESDIKMLAKRTKYLETACNVLSLIPYGVIKDAIVKEPVLNSAGHSLVKRELLRDTNPATKALYTQFKNLKAALEDEYPSLLIPAVIWIESLEKNGKLK